MAVAFKSTVGQLAATTTAIYTVPASTSTIMVSLVLFNSNSVSETIKVWVRETTGGTNRQIIEQVLATKETYVFGAGSNAVPIKLVLETTDIILAESTNASQVNYILSYAENT